MTGDLIPAPDRTSALDVITPQKLADPGTSTGFVTRTFRRFGTGDPIPLYALAVACRLKGQAQR